MFGIVDICEVSVLEDPKYYRVAHGLGVARFGN